MNLVTHNITIEKQFLPSSNGPDGPGSSMTLRQTAIDGSYYDGAWELFPLVLRMTIYYDEMTRNK